MENRITNFLTVLIMGLCCMGGLAIAKAGSLEPSGPPAPTMKTLEQIPPTWSQTLTCTSRSLAGCPRFETVLGGAAVLDKETGLVWEQSPATQELSWYGATSSCIGKSVGGRMGWRLPSVEELASLMPLASGNPFSIGSSSYFWSATYSYTDIGARFTSHYAWAAGPDGSITFSDTEREYLAWCVRGGQGNAIQLPYEATQ